jgi:hypothetical protein
LINFFAAADFFSHQAMFFGPTYRALTFEFVGFNCVIGVQVFLGYPGTLLLELWPCSPMYQPGK